MVKFKKNQEPKSHKYWFWCGRTLKGKEKVFEKELNLAANLHYIELWADRSPEIKEIKIGLGVFLKAKVVWQEVNLREEPNISSQSLILLKRGEVVEILEKAIKGEKPRSRNEEIISDRWHKVRYKDKIGYVFSQALEIEGESERAIKEKIIRKAKELNFDTYLALAIVKKESNFFPYAVSSREAKGLFQLTPIALKDIKDEFSPYNIFDIEENIEAGLRYLSKLKNIYYLNDSERELKVIAGYFAGPERVEPFIPLSKQNLSKEIERYIEEVLKFKEEFQKDLKSGGINPKVLILGSFLLTVFLVIVGLGIFTKEDLFSRTSNESFSFFRNTSEKIGKFQKSLEADLDNDGKLEKIYIKEESQKVRGITLVNTKLYFKGNLIYKGNGLFSDIRIADFNQDGKKEVIITLLPSNRALTQVFTFEKDQLKLIPILPDNSFQGFFNRYGIKIIDLEGDGIKEIFVPKGWYFTKDCIGKGEIYKFYDGKLIKFLELRESDVWCKNFKG